VIARVAPAVAHAPLIEAQDVSAGYGSVPVLHGFSIAVRPGQVVALLGPNGAGKTTALLALAGEVSLMDGHVLMDGRPAPAGLHRRARNGLRLITEDRSVFMGLTVYDNLRLAHRSVEPCLEFFPELRALLRRKVGLLSGGEQQMLTLARALTGGTRVLLADELSLGLAPLVVARLLEAVRAAADRGLGVLLVEQQARNALSVADHGYVLSRGRVIIEGDADALQARRGEIEASYLSGVADPAAAGQTNT
jgi:branched-chain amino acid transport system ATP-binding protein